MKPSSPTLPRARALSPSLRLRQEGGCLTTQTPTKPRECLTTPPKQRRPRRPRPLAPPPPTHPAARPPSPQTPSSPSSLAAAATAVATVTGTAGRAMAAWSGMGWSPSTSTPPAARAACRLRRSRTSATRTHSPHWAAREVRPPRQPGRGRCHLPRPRSRPRRLGSLHRRLHPPSRAQGPAAAAAAITPRPMMSMPSGSVEPVAAHSLTVPPRSPTPPVVPRAPPTARNLSPRRPPQSRERRRTCWWWTRRGSFGTPPSRNLDGRSTLSPRSSPRFATPRCGNAWRGCCRTSSSSASRRRGPSPPSRSLRGRRATSSGCRPLTSRCWPSRTR
mmetsp:Transcript_32420/g.84852  ORF Transcript_32420/g.84852 Transcript_32420/m.84852 type:complete len:332 (+) Transcript_32420:287-1282(+)